MTEERQAWLAELGPEASVSPPVRRLVDLAIRTALYLDHLDGILLGYKTLLDRKHQLKPLAEARDRLLNRFQALLVDVERLTAAKPAPDNAAAGVSRVLAKYPKAQEHRS